MLVGPLLGLAEAVLALDLDVVEKRCSRANRTTLARASITATATTGTVTLPLTVSLCQSDPTSGQCISSIASSVTTTINANATPTFGIFATASDGVPLVPKTNRIFAEFSGANGVVRGSTSVAVETE
jgi:hypothetical protein